MNFLFTGVPGSTKTLNAIKLICEDPQLRNRPVYYYNLDGCDIPNWTPLTEQEAKEWYKLPVGSVIFFDEAQQIFRPQARDRTKGETFTKLETSRHDGFDIVLTTQHPMFLDTHVRRNTHIHYHFERPFATKKPRRLTWQKAIDNPDDYHARQEAESERIKMDESYFGKYKSTELNTHKPRFSKKLALVIASVVVFAAGAVHFYLKKTGAVEEAQALAEPSVSSMASSLGVVPAQKVDESTFKPVYPMDQDEYLKVFTPRIKGIPSSAPVYDRLMEPVVAPRTLCFSYRRKEVNHCKCVTQQMTPIPTPLQQCLNTVENGLWDATLKPQNYDSDGRVL